MFFLYLLRTVDLFFLNKFLSDATGRGCAAHAQIHVRLNKSGAHIAVVRSIEKR